MGGHFWIGLKNGLAGLGPRRLIALALAGLFVFTTVAISSYVLSKPSRDVLYTGLDVQDVSQIGAALEEAGISFDVNTEGTAVLVEPAKMAHARMILAEKGLPRGDKSGYELFDNLGSLGLTSFMQQVTKARALEGELARTIQLLKGIKAARVHIVLPAEGGFRSLREKPSASVVIRAEAADGRAYAPAIQHLVAAAIPGMTRDMVSVMSTDGSVLAAADGQINAGAENSAALERELAADISNKIGQTLAPALGPENFRVSVSAALNTDQRQTNETVFDPESRVERSVRSVKESGEQQNRTGSSAVSVDQNIPTEATPASGKGEQASEKNDKREELTNYEINSKQTETKSGGYAVEHLSAAIIINKVQLQKIMGDKTTPEQVSAQLEEFKALAVSAAGMDEKRGDRVTISAVDFLSADAELAPIAGESLVSLLSRHLGSFINGAVLLVAVILVLTLGLKPAIRAILESKAANEERARIGAASAPVPQVSSDPAQMLAGLVEESSARARLEDLVQRDNAKAARILKEWLAEPKTEAA